MLDHMVSAQQLMFLYLYLVYLYQFVKKKKKSFYTISTLFTVCIIWLSLFFENVFCKTYFEKCHSLMKRAEI